jgi:hypothetical protein
MRRPHRPLEMLLLALLVWTALLFVRASALDLVAWRARDESRPQVLLWRFGVAPVERLRRCMRLVEAHVGPGTSLALLTPDDELMTQRWAAYFLPGRNVIGGQSAVAHADMVVAWGRLPLPPGEPVAGGPLCRIHRLR